MKAKILKGFTIVFGTFIGLFLLTFIVYFFNLDMKASEKLLPILNKIYDKGDEKRKAS